MKGFISYPTSKTTPNRKQRKNARRRIFYENRSVMAENRKERKENRKKEQTNG